MGRRGQEYSRSDGSSEFCQVGPKRQFHMGSSTFFLIQEKYRYLGSISREVLASETARTTSHLLSSRPALIQSGSTAFAAPGYCILMQPSHNTSILFSEQEVSCPACSPRKITNYLGPIQQKPKGGREPEVDRRSRKWTSSQELIMNLYKFCCTSTQYSRVLPYIEGGSNRARDLE